MNLEGYIKCWASNSTKFISEAAARFGFQCVVLSVDVKR